MEKNKEKNIPFDPEQAEEIHTVKSPVHIDNIFIPDEDPDMISEVEPEFVVENDPDYVPEEDPFEILPYEDPYAGEGP